MGKEKTKTNKQTTKEEEEEQDKREIKGADFQKADKKGPEERAQSRMSIPLMTGGVESPPPGRAMRVLPTCLRGRSEHFLCAVVREYDTELRYAGMECALAS